MSKYRYYIVDTMDGNVKATNSAETANDYAQSEDHFVIDAEKGKWLGANVSIKEIR